IERAIEETNRRREKQIAYNKVHGITPKTIEKTIRNMLEEFGLTPSSSSSATHARSRRIREVARLDMLGDGRSIEEILKEKRMRMKEAAQHLEFEMAALLRDEIRELEARARTSE